MYIRKDFNLEDLTQYEFVKVDHDSTDFDASVLYWLTFNDGDEYDCLTVDDDRYFYIGLDANSDDKLLAVMHKMILDGVLVTSLD